MPRRMPIQSYQADSKLVFVLALTEESGVDVEFVWFEVDESLLDYKYLNSFILNIVNTNTIQNI